MRIRRTGVALLAAAFGCGAGAQPFPVKAVRVVVAGSPDAVPRILAPKLAAAWGQQLIVEPRGGAGGTIGAELVARSAADGYTLLLATAQHMMNVNFYKVPYQMERDFAPVTQLAYTTFVLAVHPSLPARSVKELVALAKQRPGALNFSSGGSGSPAHLIGEMFGVETGTRMVHVPYKDVASAVVDLLTGEVQLMFLVSTAAVPQLKAGRIRGLGVTSLSRWRALPQLPTLDEAGVRGFEATAWYGLLAPAGTPAPVIGRLHADFVKALKAPDVVERLSGLGLEIVGSAPPEFAAFIRSELAKWARYAKVSGARIE